MALAQEAARIGSISFPDQSYGRFNQTAEVPPKSLIQIPEALKFNPFTKVKDVLATVSSKVTSVMKAEKYAKQDPNPVEGLAKQALETTKAQTKTQKKRSDAICAGMAGKAEAFNAFLVTLEPNNRKTVADQIALYRSTLDQDTTLKPSDRRALSMYAENLTVGEAAVQPGIDIIAGFHFIEGMIRVAEAAAIRMGSDKAESLKIAAKRYGESLRTDRDVNRTKMALNISDIQEYAPKDSGVTEFCLIANGELLKVEV